MIIKISEIKNKTDFSSLVTKQVSEPKNFDFFLKKDLKNIENNDSLIYFMTERNFRFINICETVIKQLEQPNIYFMTYAIGNKSVIKLLDLKNQGKIKNAFGLLSVRAPKLNSSAFNVLTTFAKIKLERIHAKIFIAQNENKAITILGSANLTNKNSNKEAGHITTNFNVCEFFKSKIL